jgi:hypothetical protein
MSGGSFWTGGRRQYPPPSALVKVSLDRMDAVTGWWRDVSEHRGHIDDRGSLSNWLATWWTPTGSTAAPTEQSRNVQHHPKNDTSRFPGEDPPDA